MKSNLTHSFCQGPWRLRLLGYGALALLVTSPLQAADHWSPRALALGGAGRAGPLLNESIYLNPAFGALTPANSFSMHWLKYAANDPGRPEGRNYSVAMQDGRSEIAQAGAAYTVRQDAAYVHLGVAKSVVQRLGFGIAGKYVIDPRSSAKFADAVFSMAAVPVDWFQVALIVDNLFETQGTRAYGNYRDYVLGIKLNLKGIVLAYFDPQLTPSLSQRFGYSGGLEFAVMSDLYLRWGKFQDVTVPYLGMRGSGYGAGLGWLAPRISLDYGFSRVMQPFYVSAHTLGATVYF